MSTFLQIAQSAAREMGIAGSTDASPVPTAVTSQTGELNKVVNWVIQSWTEIQNMHSNWKWMRRGFTVSATSGDDSYAFGDVTDDDASAVISRFGRWRYDDPEDEAKCYLTASGTGVQYWLPYQKWAYFKAVYKIGTQTDAPPIIITIDPQDNLVLGPQPDDTYTVTGDFQRSAQVLAADGDIPECPKQFHDVIFWRAVLKYGLDESAPEMIGKWDMFGKPMLRDLRNNQLPDMVLQGPMA